jgi:hypothetical protein
MWGRMTKNITERYLGFEAAGLKGQRDPEFRHGQTSR